LCVFLFKLDLLLELTLIHPYLSLISMILTTV